jgi:murein DD-endopeptidase MepM/ murein hydrolase activator NlpD
VKWTRRKRVAVAVLIAFIVVMLLPERPVIPVQGATSRDWNPASFWYEPWGRSGVHKGIDIFAPRGNPVVAPTYGLVLFRGDIPMGGRVLLVLGPKWRLHYFAHLQATHVYPGYPVWNRRELGEIGDTGNARGKLPHLHYAVLTLVPYPWRMDDSAQGWKKAFYLNPSDVLGIH